MSFININKSLLKENENIEKVKEYQEYYLIKQNNVFKIIIGKLKDKILIKCKTFENQLKNDDFSLFNKFDTIDELYNYIIKLFNENKVNIIDIISNKNMILNLKVSINDEEKNTELKLYFNRNSKDLIRNEIKENYNELINEINNLKEEIKILNNKVNNFYFFIGSKDFRKIKINENIELNTNHNIQFPKMKYLYEITNDSYAYYTLDNTFTIFKSINNILYLIYSNEHKDIISFDLINNKKMGEIKKAHNEFITNFRHYLDKIYKRDLFISISGKDNNIKLWDITNYKCLIDIKNINNKGELDSACFLNDGNSNFIVTSNDNYNKTDFIKIFDFNGRKIKDLKDSNERTKFVDTYYDNKLSKNYIISGNFSYIKSYDYNNNILYHKYCDNDKRFHKSIIVINNENIIKIIESSEDGNIRIWNFHSGELIKRIYVNNDWLRGICLWNNDYLFVGCKDKAIKLIELKTGIILNKLIGHFEEVLTIKKINHPKYGECLVTQGWVHDNIKLWMNNI